MQPEPRWPLVAAWGAVASVTPSAIWRVAVGVGIDLGWSADQLDRQDIPGTGTVYVIMLSLLSLSAAALTLRLVRPDGDRVPEWVPLIGGRRVPAPAVVGVSLAGVAAVGWVSVMSVWNWDRVSGFADQPDSTWALLMAACYAPALLWAPLLLAATVSYMRTRPSPSGERQTESRRAVCQRRTG